MEHRTRAVTQAEFQTAVEETLQQHETSIGQINTNVEHINATLKTMLADLQALHSETLKNAEERLNGNHSTGGPSFSKPKSQQVQLASFHLDGLALQWYHWLGKFRGPLTWNEFTRAVLHRFGPTDYDNLSEALARLKQMKQPRSLSEAIGVARLIEEQNQLQRRNMGAQRATLVSPPQCAVAQTSFVPGYCCNKPQLFMIAEPTPHDGEGEEMITEISDIENSLPEISLHAITGATHP
ncbi:hypothetical protein FEM48_Zijuj03G0170200 [Ziziphus jujuba var. spinosa]|uniref:Retrotransposon gag domain-containing protein n=1 Tax=Ziziphus jujuba var. spinosa TaxID=714518 RepID=A0A978VRJ1_ZIZJJ|nr:hypothetical protein FEM48_Zijuj03G0170200 [Ziziphus jujuba var. spinosa]